MKASNEKEGQLSCETNINRIDKGPDNWRAILGSGTLYKDPDFEPGMNALYWSDHLRPGSNELVEAYMGVN